MLLDSNIIIYAADPANNFLRALIRDHVVHVSIISKIEVLGFPGMDDKDYKFFEDFFNAADLIGINDQIVSESIHLRQRKRISLGDALIAATAMVQNFPLITRNSKDFSWIDTLQVIDPFEQEV